MIRRMTIDLCPTCDARQRWDDFFTAWGVIGSAYWQSHHMRSMYERWMREAKAATST